MHIIGLFVNFVNIKQELLCYVQKNFANSGTLYFAWWWKLLKFGKKYDMIFVANFMENTTVKILKVGQYFVKVMNDCIVA